MEGQEMTPRERVCMALNHQEPDRVPIDLGGWQSGIMAVAYDRLKKPLGIKGRTEIREVIQQLAEPDENFLQHFHIDTRYIFARSTHPWNPEKLSTGSFVGELEWGHQKIIKHPHVPYYEFYEYPLKEATVRDLEQFPYLAECE